MEGGSTVLLFGLPILFGSCVLTSGKYAGKVGAQVSSILDVGSPSYENTVLPTTHIPFSTKIAYQKRIADDNVSFHCEACDDPDREEACCISYIHHSMAPDWLVGDVYLQPTKP